MSNSQQPPSDFIASPPEPNAQPSPPTIAQAAPLAKSKKNGLAVTALVLGIVAFFGAFIPFLNFVTGFIALVGLVLGAVAIFQKRASKPMAIAGTAISFVAIILSIVMAITYTTAFATAVSDSISKPITKTQSDKADAPAANAKATDANAKFGETITYKDGLAVTVGAPVAFTPGQYAAGADQASNIAFTVTVTNGTKKNYDPLLFGTVSSGGVEGSSIIDMDAKVGLPPTTVVPVGKSITFTEAFSVGDPSDIVYDLTVGFGYDNAVFQK